jgi:hypothetical protein
VAKPVEPQSTFPRRKLAGQEYCEMSERRKAPELSRAVVEARDEALEHLGERAAMFNVAVTRYVNAVEVAAQARKRGKRRAGRLCVGMQTLWRVLTTGADHGANGS